MTGEATEQPRFTASSPAPPPLRPTSPASPFAGSTDNCSDDPMEVSSESGSGAESDPSDDDDVKANASVKTIPMQTLKRSVIPKPKGSLSKVTKVYVMQVTGMDEHEYNDIRVFQTFRCTVF